MHLFASQGEGLRSRHAKVLQILFRVLILGIEVLESQRNGSSPDDRLKFRPATIVMELCF